MAGRRWIFLDQHAFDAERRERLRQGHANRAAARNQDRNLLHGLPPHPRVDIFRAPGRRFVFRLSKTGRGPSSLLGRRFLHLANHISGKFAGWQVPFFAHAKPVDASEAARGSTRPRASQAGVSTADTRARIMADMLLLRKARLSFGSRSAIIGNLHLDMKMSAQPDGLETERTQLLRDNQGENGATIWMRMPPRGCRREGVARP